MNKIMELPKKYPVIMDIGIAFAATFGALGASGFAFNRTLIDTVFMATIGSITAGVAAAVKTLTKQGIASKMF